MIKQHFTCFHSREHKQFFFSTSHIQLHDHDETFVPVSFSLPMGIAPRPAFPDGVIRTLADYVQVFADDEIQIPNPNPAFAIPNEMQAMVIK
jgi:hypothetical protein